MAKAGTANSLGGGRVIYAKAEGSPGVLSSCVFSCLDRISFFVAVGERGGKGEVSPFSGRLGEHGTLSTQRLRLAGVGDDSDYEHMCAVLDPKRWQRWHLFDNRNYQSHST